MNRVRTIVLIVLLIGAAVTAWYLFGPTKRARTLSGYIEGEELYLGAPVSGTVASIAAVEGQRASPGQQLFRIDPATLTDPELCGYLEDARLHGTPRPESQAVRAHHPDVLRHFSRTWNPVFKAGIVEHRTKELCRVYVSQIVDCHY